MCCCPEQTGPEMQRRFFQFAFCVVSAAALAAGCAKARAETVPDGPPLAMPLPPPRVFAPVEEEPPLVAAPVPVEPPTAEAPQVPQRRPPRRPAAAETEKPEPPPQPAPPAPEAPRELRAASTPADAEAEKKIRALMQVASRNLNQVDYQRLSVAGREQYQQAKDFGEQANDALTSATTSLPRRWPTRPRSSPVNCWVAAERPSQSQA